ncbi:hypothetical protein BHE74_00032569 [Ensete ventricosum]|nr:hypothetical protein BHE74_00032569 [Ensete ventricosum]
MWYSRLKPSSIFSLDQLAKEFKLNFSANTCSKQTPESLLRMSQREDEPLAQYVTRFMAETRSMPDAHPSLVI